MKAFRKVFSIVVSVLLVAVMAVGTFTASAADSYKDYKEFKGTIAVISNCDEGDNTQKGKIDPFGVKAGTTSKEVEGDATTAGKASEDVSYSTEHYLQGKSAVKIHVAKDQTIANGSASGLFTTKTRFVIRQMDGIKVTDANTTYLSFYMYCDSPEDLKEIEWGSSSIEISQVMDSLEFEFPLTAIQQYNINGNFVAGWNKIEIPLIKGGNKTMDIKMFRFFLFSKGNKDVDIYLDNITLEKGEAFNKPTASSKPSIVGVPDASSKTSSTEETASTESADVSSEVADVTSVVEDTTVSETVSVEEDVNDGANEGGMPAWIWIVIAVVVAVIAGTAVYLLVLKKK